MYIKPPHGEYAPVDYLHVRSGRLFRIVWAVAGALTWPITIPLALLSRHSMVLFQTCSEFFALWPLLVGAITRYEFYRFALEKCGRNVLIGFGTVFNYPDVRIGDNVLIGRYNVIHHCDFGSFTMTGERCTFLSGSRQHNFDRADVPMYLQGGQLKRITIGDNVWVGAHAVVMDDVGSGSIVAAGAIVTRAVPGEKIVVGSRGELMPRFRTSQQDGSRDAG